MTNPCIDDEDTLFYDDETGDEFEPDAVCWVCGTGWTYGPDKCPECNPISVALKELKGEE